MQIMLVILTKCYYLLLLVAALGPDRLRSPLGRDRAAALAGTFFQEV